MLERQKITAWTKFLLPSVFGNIFYFVVIALSILATNISHIQNIFSAVPELNPRVLLDNTLGSFLSQYFGEDLVARLVSVVFWAVIGICTYLFILLITKFTSELNDDLAIDRYQYPAGADKYSRLKSLVFVSLERIIGIALLVVYANTVMDKLFPFWAKAYRDLINYWPPEKMLIISFFSALVIQFIVLHCAVLLLRVIIQRNRILGI